MIDPTRLEILRLLGQLSELEPEVRFGQLVANMAFLAAGPWNETLWDLEDNELLSAVSQHLADLSRTQPQVAEVG